MARFCSVLSGSTGNCCYAASGRDAVLVDAGLNFKRINENLSEHGLDPAGIRGVFITHEHSDHIKGLKVLVKRWNIPVYGNGKTLDYLASHDCVPGAARLLEIDAQHPVEFDDLKVRIFPTSHDSVDSAGFRISTSDGRQIGVATDLGYISEPVRDGLSGCDLIMLESNHDTRMLEASAYPYYLIRRIQSKTGHLSNADCAAYLPELVESGATRFVLGHLSKENNLPQLARQEAMLSLCGGGMREELDFLLDVAPRFDCGRLMIF